MHHSQSQKYVRELKMEQDVTMNETKQPAFEINGIDSENSNFS